MNQNACCCERNLVENHSNNNELIKQIISKYRGKKGALIPVLHEVQEVWGYLPLKAQKMVAEGLDIPLAEVYGVVTFYTQFSTEPKGKYRIQVCLGTACYVKGAGEVLQKFSEELGIEVGKCTPDGMFSLDAARCIGACGLAPVVMINDQVYGSMTPEKVEDVLKEIGGEEYENNGWIGRDNKGSCKD